MRLGWALKIPGIFIADAKSLYDHLQKDSSVPVERQTLIVDRKCIENPLFSDQSSVCGVHSFGLALSRWCLQSSRSGRSNIG